MDYPEINQKAGEVSRFLTMFQLLSNEPQPAIRLKMYAEMLQWTSNSLVGLLEAHPDAVVTFDTRLSNNVTDLLGASLMGDIPTVPDTIPDDLQEG